MRSIRTSVARSLAPLALAAVATLALAACGGGGGSDGSGGPAGPPGPEGPPGPGPADTIGWGEPLPGVVPAITGVTGGTGPGGNFRAGDTLTVTFTLKNGAGADLLPSDMDSGSIYVAGPSFNYQRVLFGTPSYNPRTATFAGAGTWSFTFPAPIPATYMAPYNDSTAFGALDGELAGQPLLDGTYTVGLQLYKNEVAEETTYRDAGVSTFDFLVGAVTSIEHREVVTNSNCNACHTELRMHGGSRKDVRLCVLCHTSGAEDKNGPPDPTPGVAIDFRVMIHKIHNAAHLPSVVGVSTNLDGTKNWTTAPQPLEYAGYSGTPQDFSDVLFPVFPSFNIAMPKDQGYSSLSSTDPDGTGPLLSPKAREDLILKGVVSCEKCHGGAAQGDLYMREPSRRACGSCHDDVDFSRDYVSNGATMPPQPNDGACSTCHLPSLPGSMPVRESHLHPLKDPAVDPGLKMHLVSIADAGGAPIGAGDKVRVTVTATNDAGTPVALNDAAMTSIVAVVNGPTQNPNLLLYNMSIPNTAFAAGTGPWTLNLPMNVALELLGTSTASPTDGFTSALAPHMNLLGSGTNTTDCRTHVFVRSATGTSTTTVAASIVGQSWLDVSPASASAFSPVSSGSGMWTNFVVLEDGTGNREYAKIRSVDTTRGRIWLDTGTGYPTGSGTLVPQGAPLRKAHASGSAVTRVTLAERTVGTQWSLVAGSGVVTEIGDAFGGGADVLVNYTTDFVMPATYPPPYNDSPDLGETIGEWQGKPLIAGTYRVGLYGYANRVVALWGETQTYRGTSEPEWGEFLFGGATTLDAYSFTTGDDTCNRCHDDLRFHGGGRRGFQACILCHGTASLEDNPSTASPQPPVVNAAFREMLHKIHMGEDLPDAATYVFAGEGAFPAMPGGVKQCVKCHGDPPEPPQQPWKAPSSHAYPGSATPTRMWTLVCGSCHDTDAAHAHMDVASPGGVESCDVCHGAGALEDVKVVHLPR